MEVGISSLLFGVAPILPWVGVDVVVFRWVDKHLDKGLASARTRKVRYPMSMSALSDRNCLLS